ncbi:MAG TPA: alpha/beta fold hydrolase [Tepidisphaeraceae bacterium]|nr:alpha/beta fold hydrolase [Tepidisphaeraceae bacterium]
MLLIQGVNCCGCAWRPQVDALAGRFACLSFDNRGIGASERVAGGTGGTRPPPLSAEQMAADALALMDAAGWSSAHVVGHSLGGIVAQHLALTARHRVRSLSLLCTTARGADITRPSLAVVWMGIRTRVGTRRMRRRAFLDVILPPSYLASRDRDAIAGELADVFGHDLADTPSIVGEQLAALKAYDATPRLFELAGVPTLVVSAAGDRIVPPRLGRALAAAVPGARYVEIPDAAHAVTVQRPDEVNALLAEHLSAAEVPMG